MVLHSKIRRNWCGVHLASKIKLGQWASKTLKTSHLRWLWNVQGTSKGEKKILGMRLMVGFWCEVPKVGINKQPGKEYHWGSRNI
jgi:hypothetical protein